MHVPLIPNEEKKLVGIIQRESVNPWGADRSGPYCAKHFFEALNDLLEDWMGINKIEAWTVDVISINSAKTNPKDEEPEDDGSINVSPYCTEAGCGKKSEWYFEIDKV
jgi:hypothetical protein